MKDKLYRSRRVRIFGGVAGGLAEYFKIDPIIVRIIFVVITILHGVGVLLYIILLFVVPEEPFEMAYKINPEPGGEQPSGVPPNTTDFVFAQQKKSSDTGRIVAGVILIGIGMIFFADRFIPSFSFEDIFPIIFVILGGALIWNSLNK